MPVIRISDETMQRLKTWAEPLVDTAESAVAKALDAAEQSRSEQGIEHVESSLSAKSSDAFAEHLLAIPDVGDDADFERDPSGLRRVEL